MSGSPSGAKERLAVGDDALIACLRQRYGLAPSSIEFLPVGYDADAWVYRVVANDGAEYFLKLKRQIERPEILQVPHYLREHGTPQVVAPLATTAGELWTTIGALALILYPFVAGTNGLDAGLTLAQWTELGAILGSIHQTALPEKIADRLPRETFRPDEQSRAAALSIVSDAAMAPPDDIAADLLAFLSDKRDLVARLVRRCDELGARLRQRDWDFVLCHADIHVANVILDTGGHVVIVDWDQPTFAPRERDLMFSSSPALAGFTAGSAAETAFFEGYGSVVIDPVADAYYRYAWAV
ncbi:MAG TPA: phosphotransferase [Nitrolancea sp.]|nr:phosphotransferase [Nitrolancea sp.]